MKIKLTKEEDEVLWLLQRKGRILELRYALKKSRAEVLEIIATLAEKTGFELLNEKDINKGKFWKAHGVVTPMGQR
jgi:hypothetical protein